MWSDIKEDWLNCDAAPQSHNYCGTVATNKVTKQVMELMMTPRSGLYGQEGQLVRERGL